MKNKNAVVDDFVAVAKTSEIEEGKVKVVRVGDAPVGVTLIEGEYFAFADVCTHDDGPVAEGELDDHTIECPRHGAAVAPSPDARMPNASPTAHQPQSSA